MERNEVRTFDGLKLMLSDGIKERHHKWEPSLMKQMRAVSVLYVLVCIVISADLLPNF